MIKHSTIPIILSHQVPLILVSKFARSTNTLLELQLSERFLSPSIPTKSPISMSLNPHKHQSKTQLFSSPKLHHSPDSTMGELRAQCTKHPNSQETQLPSTRSIAVKMHNLSAWQSAKENPRVVLFSLGTCLNSALWGFDVCE